MHVRPHHREFCALPFSYSAWVLLCPTELWTMKSCETGPTVYLPYLRRLESLAICRCNLQRQPCLINNWNNYYLITIITKILSFFGFNLLVAMKHRIPLLYCCVAASHAILKCKPMCWLCKLDVIVLQEIQCFICFHFDFHFVINVKTFWAPHLTVKF